MDELITIMHELLLEIKELNTNINELKGNDIIAQAIYITNWMILNQV